MFEKKKKIGPCSSRANLSLDLDLKRRLLFPNPAYSLSLDVFFFFKKRNQKRKEEKLTSETAAPKLQPLTTVYARPLFQASSWGTRLNIPNGPSGSSIPRRNAALLRPLVARMHTAYAPSNFS